MTNCLRTDISQYNDINTLDQYQVALDAGCSKNEALAACYAHSRDNARTPMHWSDAPNAGFTSGIPWLSLNPNYMEINVAEQENRPDSVLNYYRKLIALRKNEACRPTFTYGKFTPAYEDVTGVLAYRRSDEQHNILVAANYGTEPQTFDLDSAKQVLLSNVGCEDAVLEQINTEGKLTLAPCESVVILL